MGSALLIVQNCYRALDVSLYTGGETEKGWPETSISSYAWFPSWSETCLSILAKLQEGLHNTTAHSNMLLTVTEQSLLRERRGGNFPGGRWWRLPASPDMARELDWVSVLDWVSLAQQCQQLTNHLLSPSFQSCLVSGRIAFQIRCSMEFGGSQGNISGFGGRQKMPAYLHCIKEQPCSRSSGCVWAVRVLRFLFLLNLLMQTL